MFFTRERLEQIERQTLAPYACLSSRSRGRTYPEREHPYRTVFQRDRDRILHTTAFRRLEYKTQVFVYSEGDHYRTRLTHTLEVAQIGRTVARALGANEDLVEAICLAHDLGHPAFGHAGEQTLNRLMADHGGFDHNRQSLRIVGKLELRYPDFPGLNLSWEVREGIVKHETEYDVSSAQDYDPELRGNLEAQIANAADEIAYNAHDLDDGLRAGMLNPADVSGLAWWTVVRESIGWDGDGEVSDLIRRRMIRRLLGKMIADLIKQTDLNLEAEGVDSVEAVQRLPHNLIAFSDEVQARTRELKDFLFQRLYRHHRVMRMQTKAERIISELFNAYVDEPRQMPETIQARLQETSLHRVVCDYVAGMTDRFALQEHAKLFDPSERV
ncbi:MAG: deoxyguanosinetriphosphate triphosphohydrolase [Anaerolineae bacterium]|nr:MAG: deoxyguanosinetriphosphate triphosphohydrolase [Anaerolineae bacterium]